jgi:hypothetical protein
MIELQRIAADMLTFEAGAPHAGAYNIGSTLGL